MGDLNEFLVSIEKLRSDVARFHRVVLHTHSLRSTDYGRDRQGNVVGSAASTDEQYKEFILRCNVDLVAVTDHMKCDFSCHLSEEAASKGRCILPGMEVSIRPPAPWDSFKMHLVTVFPECHSLEQIARMLPKTMPP